MTAEPDLAAEEAAARQLVDDIDDLINAAPTTRAFSAFWALAIVAAKMVTDYSTTLSEAESRINTFLQLLTNHTSTALEHKFPN